MDSRARTSVHTKLPPKLKHNILFRADGTKSGGGMGALVATAAPLPPL